MSEEHDSLSDRIEKALSYPAPSFEPAAEEDQRESARQALEIKEELEEQTGADLGAP